jgi:hypothetical protein
MGSSDSCLGPHLLRLRATATHRCRSPTSRNAVCVRAVPITPVSGSPSSVGCSDDPSSLRRINGGSALTTCPFEACSGFTRVTARTLAGPPCGGRCRWSFDGSVTFTTVQLATEVSRQLLGPDSHRLRHCSFSWHTLTWADLPRGRRHRSHTLVVRPGPTNAPAPAPAPHEKQPLDTAPRRHGDRLENAEEPAPAAGIDCTHLRRSHHRGLSSRGGRSQ